VGAAGADAQEVTEPSTPAIIVGAMTSKLAASLRQAPVTAPALAALALFVVWAGSQAGYPLTHWAPGGLIVLALLALALTIVGLRAAEQPRSMWIALLALAAYTLLSFLSILWAKVPADAWEGADRTLLYLLVFALFACWRHNGYSAALLLLAWTFALIALALYAALHLDAATSAGLQSLLPGGRLLYPTGYPNANAAQWLMAFWPALLLARSERLPWPVRGLLAGGAVLLGSVALLSQSRGSLYATPAMLVLVFALIPGRTRTFALLAPVAAGLAAVAPAVLRVGDHLRDGEVVRATLHSAITATLLAAVVVAAIVAVGAAMESRVVLSEGSRRRIGRGLSAIALTTLIAVLAGGLAAAGNPVTRIRHGWDSFKGGYGADKSTGSRLVSGLGSNRYDFYRVALDEFLAHPLLGIGADNFQQQYLEHGRSDETPHYPHSVELRTLAETGLLGSALALLGLGGALWAAARALRRSDPLARSVAAAALAGFAYWVIHGSFDWFWEFAGLGAPAFALLGIACSLAPQRVRASVAARGSDRDGVAGADASAPAEPRAGTTAARGVWSGRVGALALALLALAAVYSFGAPWLSQLEVESAAHVWTRAPQTAYARLREAARLNPLSDEADSVAASIALRYGELARANSDFAAALVRSPSDPYATLELGAIASAQGRRPAALARLQRAAQLNPRDPLTREALQTVRAGRRVNLTELNRAILLKAEQF
jgi:tetratricopeptide (TPR) repeat protein